MNWTEEKPTTPGWYWYLPMRGGGTLGTKPRVWRVYRPERAFNDSADTVRGLCVDSPAFRERLDSHGYAPSVCFLPGMWAGPISEPGDI